MVEEDGPALSFLQVAFGEGQYRDRMGITEDHDGFRLSRGYRDRMDQGSPLQEVQGKLGRALRRLPASAEEVTLVAHLHATGRIVGLQIYSYCKYDLCEEAAGDPAYCHRPEEKYPFIRPADPGLHFHHLFFMTHMFEGRSTNWSTVRRHRPVFP